MVGGCASPGWCSMVYWKRFPLSLALEVFLSTRFRPRIGAAALAASALMLAACRSTSSSPTASSTTAAEPTSSTAATAPIAVVASTNVWGDIAKQVGGDHVNVTSIMSDPNADPHEYEADAQTAAATEQGAVRDRKWLGLRRFHGQAARGVAQPKSARFSTPPTPCRSPGRDANPHIWYDIAKVPDVASAIADQLGKLDPADAATFTANAKTFSDSLAPINAAIANIKAKYPGAPDRLHRTRAGLSRGRRGSDAGHARVVRTVDRGRQRPQPG